VIESEIGMINKLSLQQATTHYPTHNTWRRHW